MYRAILPDGNVSGARYERTQHGVEIYTEAEVMRAFVPYENLVALMNEEVDAEEHRSIL